jgi:hypothetical protein
MPSMMPSRLASVPPPQATAKMQTNEALRM